MKNILFLALVVLTFFASPLTAQATVQTDVQEVQSNINGLGTSH